MVASMTGGGRMIEFGTIELKERRMKDLGFSASNVDVVYYIVSP